MVQSSLAKAKELETIFNSPPRYGKGLDWSGYSVFDAANVLTRYLVSLPEPIIPTAFYQRFHEPLQILSQREGESVIYEGTVEAYQNLIEELPPYHKQLLLYMLDFLAVFASKAEKNGMSAAFLAMVFQPGLLRRRDSHLRTKATTDDVLTFLIENQDHFAVNLGRVAFSKQA